MSSDETEPPVPAPDHARVFVSDGGYFCLPIGDYEAVREAIRRGDDYEGVDLYGESVFLAAGYMQAVSRRAATTNAARAAVTWS